MQKGTLSAVVIGADIDMAAVRKQYPGYQWLAHIVDSGLADGFLLDHKPDVAVVSALTVEKAPLLERRHPQVSIIPYRGRNETTTVHHGTGDEIASTDASRQQLVAVWSPKGGVGKSFIATNVAVIRALSFPSQVALIDLDLHSSDIGVYLDLLEGPGIVNILPHLSGMTPQSLDEYMLQHPRTGLWVLPGPTRPEMADFVRGEQVNSLLTLARRRFDQLFIDLPPHAGEDIVYECLEQASCILLITTQDAATIRQTRLTLDTMTKLRIDISNRVRVVLNRYHDENNITVDRISSFIGQPITTVIGDDRSSAERAMFEGTPLVLSKLNATITTSLEELARDLGSRPIPAPQQESSLWAALKRRLVDGITRAS